MQSSVKMTWFCSNNSWQLDSNLGSLQGRSSTNLIRILAPNMTLGLPGKQSSFVRTCRLIIFRRGICLSSVISFSSIFDSEHEIWLYNGTSINSSSNSPSQHLICWNIGLKGRRNLGKRQAKPACSHALALIKDDRVEILDSKFDHRRIAVFAGAFKGEGTSFFTIWCRSRFLKLLLVFTIVPCWNNGLLHVLWTTFGTDFRELDVSCILLLGSLNITAVEGIVLDTINPEFAMNSVE